MSDERGIVPQVELVVAIVRPVGTPDEPFQAALAASFNRYSYRVESIKLSQLISDDARNRGKTLESRPEHHRINALMSEGDAYCRRFGQPAAVSLMGVTEVKRLRSDAAKEGAGRVVYLLDSLKRPDEVTQLRRIYGDRLLLIGLQASQTKRRASLIDRIKAGTSGLSGQEAGVEVDKLIKRDLNETGDRFTQNVLQAFPMADVFIDLDDVHNDVTKQVQRVVDLLFGSPEYPRPTDAEFGMNLAYLASTRSAELGLKVGAAVLRHGSALALGANEPPEHKEAPPYDANAAALRDLVLDMLTKLSSSLTPEARDGLESDGDTYVRQLLDGPLKRVSAATGYCPEAAG